MRQPEFDFFGEEMVGRPMPENITFVSYPAVNSARRQNICGNEWRKARARNSWRCAVSAGYLFRDDYARLFVKLSMRKRRVVRGKINEASKRDQSNESARRL